MEEDFGTENNLNKNKIIIGLAIIGLIVIAAIFLLPLIFSLNYFGVVDIPGFSTGNSNSQVLVIGELSLGEKVVLDNLSSELNYRNREIESFGLNAFEELSQYNIIIIDQSRTKKAVTIDFGKAIEEYVKNGGKLIIVQNSGIYQGLDLEDYSSSDVISWKANFGDIIPVSCVLGSDSVPVCAEGQEINVVGRIRRQIKDHPIMNGIEISPPVNNAPYSLTVFDIESNEGANTIAYFKSENTPKSYPAILEKKSFIGGNVIYFNYDPGFTPGILTNTLRYLK